MVDGGPDEVVVEREPSEVGAELRALFGATRTTVLLIVTAGLVVLQTWALTRFLGSAERLGGETAIRAGESVQILASATATGVLGAFVLGALAPWVAGRRNEVGAELTGKAVAHAAVGLVYGVIAVGLVAVTLVAATAVAGTELTDLTSAPMREAALRAIVAYPLWALIGLGVGALAGSPVVAVAVGLFWPHVESAVRYLFGASWVTAGSYLPFQATGVLVTGDSRLAQYFVPGGSAGTAVVTVVAYTAVILGAGVAVTALRLPADDGGDLDDPADPPADAEVPVA